MLDSRRVAGVALLLLPAGLTVYLAFNSGGFYPGPPAYAAVLLCLALALRVTLAGNPLQSAGPWLIWVGGALALYVLLTLLSQIWSHAPGRALIEFDRALTYLLVLVLCASLVRTRERLVWLLRALAAAIVVVCLCGLLTRLLPHLWPTSPELANNRLSFPVTYWNALGLMAACGVVLCLHLSSDARDSVLGRVVAAVALPIPALTLYFTFSRGGIAAMVIGVVVYVLIARPKGLLSAALAVGPPTAVAIKVAYDANLLATSNPTTQAAVVQGKHVALVGLICCLAAGILRGGLALTLDRRLDRVTMRDLTLGRIRRVGWATLIVGTLIALVALNGRIAHEYHGFVHGQAPSNSSDYRTRLTDPSNNGRLELWRVAWHQFQRAPALGHGAGTFENTWAQYRPGQEFVLDAHSLYLETVDELGLVGLVLLASVIVGLLVRTALGARGPDRPLHAAVFAVMLMWVLHAVLDWDWEMPAVTLPIFALGGLMLARSERRSETAEAAGTSVRPLTPYTRVLAGVACLLLAVAPAYMWLSQRQLDHATSAFAQGNCRAATSSALSSMSILGNRPEPYEVISYCDIRRNMPDVAIAMINKAISLDPNNWNYRYDLAVMRASAGLNPMAAARKALQLDPLEPLVQQMFQAFAGGNRASWESNGKQIADGFTTL